MKNIKISAIVKTTEQLVRFLEVMEDIEDRFDDIIEIDVKVDSGEGVLERW